MSAHTPGPWYVHRPQPNSLPHIRSAVNDHYVMDAPPRNSRAHGKVRQDADARLIAAAPELLEALKSTSQLLMAAALVIEHAESRAHAIATAKGAQAAIAKAEAA